MGIATSSINAGNGVLNRVPLNCDATSSCTAFSVVGE